MYITFYRDAYVKLEKMLMKVLMKNFTSVFLSRIPAELIPDLSSIVFGDK